MSSMGGVNGNLYLCDGFTVRGSLVLRNRLLLPFLPPAYLEKLSPDAIENDIQSFDII